MTAPADRSSRKGNWSWSAGDVEIVKRADVADELADKIVHVVRLLHAEKYSEDQERDEQGRFTAGGGGGGDGGGGGRGGAQDARMAHERATQGLPSRLPPKDLHSFMEEAAQGEPANLQHLQIEGDENRNLYSKHLTDRARSQMPQLPTDADGMGRYRDFLRDNGVETELDEVDPRDLIASQAELDASKVAKIYQVLAKGDGLKEGAGTLIVGKDNGVVDGHHRWAALAAYAATGHDVKVPVLRLSEPVEKVLDISNEFSKLEGIGPRSFGQKIWDLIMKAAAGVEPPNKDEPWMYIHGQWIRILVDNDEADALYGMRGEAKKADFFTDEEGIVHPLGGGGGDDEGDGGGGGSSPKEWASSLSKERVANLKNYSENAYSAVNTGLRSGRKLDEFHQSVADDVEKAIAAYTSTQERTLYRGLGTSMLQIVDGKASMLSLKEGMTLTDKGFVSTTDDKDFAAKFAAKGQGDRAAVMAIKVPAGTNMAPVHEVSEHPEEHEVLLGRGSSFRITGAERQTINGNTVTVFHAEYVK